MDSLKSWYKRKKADHRFKKAGPGQSLSHAVSDGAPPATGAAVAPSAAARRQPNRSELSPAAQAALDRIEARGQRGKPSAEARRQQEANALLADMGLSASQQAAAEAAAQQASSSPTPPTSHLAVRVECPLTGQIIREMDVTEHLTLQLLELYDISPLDASAKMIHSLCPDPAVRDTCVTTICKYLQNAIDHPGDEKFRKIRQGNKVFQERVDSVLGGKDFLVATGFQETTLEDESYLVLPDGVDEAFLEAAQALISSNQRVEFPLYRDPQVLRVGDGASIALRTELPPDFYAITLEDVKLQHKLNAAKMDEMLSLRTKAMREAQADKRKRIYRFCLLRVRINADYVLQGTFRVTDTLQALYQFVSEALADETVEFELQTQHNRQRLPRDSTTMRKADLVPTASMALIAPTPVDLKDTFKAMAQRVN